MTKKIESEGTLYLDELMNEIDANVRELISTAMGEGRTFVIPNDVRSVSHPVLRHRLLLNYEGKARGISADQVVDSIIDNVPVH